MTTKERREREKQELKQSILKAARDIAAKEGWQSVTMRKIADAIDYSPPTIYEHFDNKDGVLRELGDQGHKQLAAAMRRARESAPKAEGPIAISKAYIKFVLETPELYQVMMGLGGAPRLDKRLFESGAAIMREVQMAYQDWAVATGVDSSRVQLHDAIRINWVLAHGMVASLLSGNLDGGESEALRLLESAMRSLLAAWSNKG